MSGGSYISKSIKNLHQKSMRGETADKMTLRHLIFAGTVIVALVGAGLTPAQAQNADTRALLQRINQLEKQIDTLNRAVYRGDGRTAGGDRAAAPSPSPAYASGDVSSGVAANLEVRLSQIEGQMQQMTGQIEQQQNTIRRMKQDLERAITDIEARLAVLESGGRGPVISRSPSTETPGGYVQPSNRLPEGVEGEVLDNQDYQYPSVQTLGSIRRGDAGQDNYQPDSTSGERQAAGYIAASPQALYDQAFSLLRDANYPQAEEGFRDFLDEYPDHTLASNAQYWLAETYYVRNEYEQAARLFAEGYQKYPKASKAADNLLKLGLSLASMGKKEDACLTYQQFLKEFPNDRTPVAERARQEKSRLGCQ